ncbi:gas vesicle protein K [Streptosporangium sp. NPDC006930]|uniref:gas vesicle protein K n=1 Tax=Streptosporangium sp. NPDC006930 TaxID=3154783 RepID=UPI003428D215
MTNRPPGAPRASDVNRLPGVPRAEDLGGTEDPRAAWERLRSPARRRFKVTRTTPAGKAGTARGPARTVRWKVNTDPEAVGRDLSRLVLTLVELIRQLVERQCVRRMDQGDLSDEQVEVLGVTLMRLEEAMIELCERFELSPSDLNLDLGPLGTLLPTD